MENDSLDSVVKKSQSSHNDDIDPLVRHFSLSVKNNKDLEQNLQAEPCEDAAPKVTSTPNGGMLLRLEQSEGIEKEKCLPVKISRPTNILEEDEYANTLEAIITRDYFSGNQQNGMVPDMTLDQFQAQFTSEDNDSFNTLLENDIVARRDKYEWLWKNYHSKLKTIASHSVKSNYIQNNGNKFLELEHSNPRNSVMFVPDAHNGANSTGCDSVRKRQIVSANTKLTKQVKAATANNIPNKTSRLRKDSPSYSIDSQGRPNINSYSIVPTSNFKIANPTKQEEVHDELLEKFSASKHTTPSLSVDSRSGRITKTPIRGNKNFIAMSPAASRMLKGIGKIKK